MIDVRPFGGLGRYRNDWLNARHHFSFGEYHDRSRMGIGALRVWNDDIIAAGTGFPPHPHRDMEIVTYVREGAITHEDHLGNRGRTEAGDVQVMSAGTGIVHAEYNMEPSDTRIFQIWILTDRNGHEPRWETGRFPKDDRAGQLVPLASGRSAEREAGALPINQDAAVLGATLRAGQSVTHAMAPGRHAYLVPAKGEVTVNGLTVHERDGAAISGEEEVTVTAAVDSEILLVDVPA